MEKKTIGVFLAALRKTHGLTQQEVADRLNVSNKTVSKWERDESAPDLSLIPVLAELYGVTCDEILLGERRPSDAPQTAEARSVKADKQIKRLADYAVTIFRSVTLLSILMAVVGYIVLLSLSYAYYKPVLGFGLCMAFLATGLAVAAIQLNYANHRLDGGVDWDEEPHPAILTARARIWRLFFYAVAAHITVFFLSLPLVIFQDDSFANSVVSFDYYLQYTLFIFLPLAGVAVLIVYHLLRRNISSDATLHWTLYRIPEGWVMNLLQWALLVISFLLALRNATLPLFLGFAVISVAIVAVYTIRADNRHHRMLFVAMGARNLLQWAFPVLVAFMIRTRSVSDGYTYSIRLADDAVFVIAIYEAIVLAVYAAAKYQIVKRIKRQ